MKFFTIIFFISFLFFQCAYSQTCEWAEKINNTCDESEDEHYGKYEYHNNMIVDSSGNIYIVGPFSNATLNFNNNISLVNSGGYDAFVVKYNSDGICQWAQKIAGTCNEYTPYIAIDSTGNIYVTGKFTSTTLNFNHGITLTKETVQSYYLSKYNSDGNCQWAESITGNQSIMINTIAVDNSGCAYIGGYYNCNQISFNNGISLNSSISVEGFIAKYSSSGTCQWAEKISNDSYQSIESIAIDGYGNALVVGDFDTSVAFNNGISLNSDGFDAFVAKYNSNGTCQWAEKISNGCYHCIESIVIDRYGKALVAGSFFTSIAFNNNISLTSRNNIDGFIAKYDSTGLCQWAINTIHTEFAATELSSVDGLGNFYVAGHFSELFCTFNNGIAVAIKIQNCTVTHYDGYIAKYNTTGLCQWAQGIGTSNCESRGRANSLFPDRSGNVYVNGRFDLYTVSFNNGISLNTDSMSFFIAKYNPTPCYSLITSKLSNLSCCSGGIVNVPYSVTRIYDAGNTFTAQLSNAYGSFDNPTSLDALIDSIGLIVAIIPESVTPGTGYRIRVVSSSPVVIGDDNGENITISQSPTIFTVTGGGTYCYSDTNAHVGLNGSQPGVIYELYLNGDSHGIPINGTGDPILFNVQNIAGIYKIVGTNTTTSCSSTMADSASITFNPLPKKYEVIGGGSYCSGDIGVTVALSESEIGFRYQLRVNGKDIGSAIGGSGKLIPFGYQTTSGTYTVVSTNIETHCSQVMKDSVVVNIKPSPAKFTIKGGGSECYGGSGFPIVLNKSEKGISYQLKVNGTNTGAPILGTGDSLLFPNQNIDGKYTVVGINSQTNCIQQMKDSVIITIYPLPTQYIVTGGGSYCLGGTGVPVGLSSSQIDLEYQLQLNDNNYGGRIVGTGDSISFGNQTVHGTYTVWGINPISHCIQLMSGDVGISNTPSATQFTVTGGGSYNEGGSGVAVGLSNSQTGITYQLTVNGANTGIPVNGTGSPISFGNQTAEGTYKVIGTNTETNCSRVMSDSVEVVIIPPPNVNIKGKLSVCEKNTEHYSSSKDDGYTKSWRASGGQILGDTKAYNIDILWGDNGLGSITLYQKNDITGSEVSNKQDITINPLPAKPVISENQKSLSTNSALAYQWYLDTNKITGANKQTYKPAKSGTYKVEITDANGCSNISDPYYFDITSVSEELSNNFNLTIVPNPFNSKTSISFILKSSGYASISIIDLLGDEVVKLCDNQYFNTGQQNIEFDAGSIPAGIYLCVVEFERFKEVRKMVVMK